MRGCPEGVECQNNILYSNSDPYFGSGYEQDSEGLNKNNLIYYNNELLGSEPHPFNGSGNFFIGGEYFDEYAYVRNSYNMNNYFFPVISSMACNGSINPPGVAVGALPCVCTNDSQCIEVFGSGATCDINTGECVGGTVGTLSPFTQLLNFLKGLLTKETGKAILTGKTITGDVVNGTNENGESKVPYIILSLFVVIILIIVIIIAKIKKKSGKKFGKR